MSDLTHIDKRGKMKMVDVSEKKPTRRVAVARGSISMNQAAYDAIKNNTLSKGEALSTARLAGIMAAKKTAELIPLCHPLKISSVSIEFKFDDENKTVIAESRVTGVDVTGMEMEALVAVSIALLTIYDMAKAIDKSMVMSNVRLVYKEGGKSGVYVREGETVDKDW